MRTSFLDDPNFLLKAVGIMVFVPLLGVILTACFSEQPLKPQDDNGWREVTPPRPDLQCWVRWNRPESVVCAQSLTSTHGASQ